MAKGRATQYNTGTREAILDVAERHFALNGFAGTSMRAITKEADVNQALIGYHFEDKEGLFKAVVERFAAPVVTDQLQRLRELLKRGDASVHDVIVTFYEPPIKRVHALGPDKGDTLSLFLGRAQTEPDPVYSMIDPHYAACRNEYIQAFRILVPGLDEPEYQWRFEFMLALIVTFLTRQKMIRARYSKKKDWDPYETIARLAAFCDAGMTVPFRWE